MKKGFILNRRILPLLLSLCFMVVNVVACDDTDSQNLGGQTDKEASDKPGKEVSEQADKEVSDQADKEASDQPDKQVSALAFVATDDLSDDVVEITISQFSYKPDSVTVDAGTIIVWRNQDPVGHNAAFVEKDLPNTDTDIAGPIVGQGESFAVKFSKTGKYNYYCTPHPFMKGAVIVE